ncbi:MAG: hypothetical protein AAFV85_10840 [Cyanobacteria bacterium J06634_6]
MNIKVVPPMLTCEAVISEAWFLLQRANHGIALNPSARPIAWQIIGAHNRSQ